MPLFGVPTKHDPGASSGSSSHLSSGSIMNSNSANGGQESLFPHYNQVPTSPSCSTAPNSLDATNYNHKFGKDFFYIV